MAYGNIADGFLRGRGFRQVPSPIQGRYNVNDRAIREIWFGTASQTLFRNLAVGIYSCMEVCTQKCVMNMLDLPAQGALIALGMGLPYQEAQKFAEILILSNEPAAAMPIVQELLARDPANAAVQGMHDYLGKLRPS